jgi:hypothetical protein
MSIFFLSPSLTGNVIGANGNPSSLLGGILFVLGAGLGLFSFVKNK